MPRARIFIADDHPVLLAGLKKLLGDDYDLVGTAADGRALVTAANKIAPDLVIVDISMPGMNGIDATRRLRTSLPSVKFVILSVHADSAYVDEAFRAGARGYVLKQSAASELFTAIRAVLSGRTYVTPMIARRAQRSMRTKRLTLRQMEVVRLVAEGLQNKEIAQELKISLKTVEYHKSRIRETLNLHTSAALTRYAIDRGITAR